MHTLYVYSIYMYFESRKSNLCKGITLGVNHLTLATSCKYVGLVISNNLSDQSGIREAYMQNIHFCSTAVKFTTALFLFNMHVVLKINTYIMCSHCTCSCTCIVLAIIL